MARFVLLVGTVVDFFESLGFVGLLVCSLLAAFDEVLVGEGRAKSVEKCPVDFTKYLGGIGGVGCVGAIGSFVVIGGVDGVGGIDDISIGGVSGVGGINGVVVIGGVGGIDDVVIGGVGGIDDVVIGGVGGVSGIKGVVAIAGVGGIGGVAVIVFIDIVLRQSLDVLADGALSDSLYASLLSIVSTLRGGLLIVTLGESWGLGRRSGGRSTVQYRLNTDGRSSAWSPTKDLEDTLFQGGRELWLAKRLTDPDIYFPLQASKESPSPPGVRFKTKAAVHRYLASEFNQQKEHDGFVVDEMKIKNKIAKISQHFKVAHRFRHSSGVGRTDEVTWRDAVKERYTYYFILEPVWSSVWNDDVTLCTDSLTNSGNNVISDGEPDGPSSSGSIQRHSDGSSEGERSDADTRSGCDQGWVDVVTATEDDSAGEAAEGELDECLERSRYRTATRVTPAFGSQGTILSQADQDEGQKDRSGGSKLQPKSPRSDLLQEPNALGRYEVDA
ncbi:hypothetical protein BKA57DRAFT_441345 [Linnemannia elongata]|nr:hypothetical protein BKA57DRAFT_441345 [Linnemannia elongata]